MRKIVKKYNKGFSVIELLAVIVILGLIIAIAIPVVNKQLNNFRDSYYKKLEASIMSAGQDYVSDKRFAKPTKLLHSRVIKVEELEDENYIDEVKDYLGNYCDSSDTSYSYVLVVKTGEKTYDYQTCLKCSNDEYLTDTSREVNDYCNPAWLNTEDVEYEYTYDDSFLYIYQGTSEDDIKKEVGLTYNVVKKDKKGNILSKLEPLGDEQDILYPENINELIGGNLNSVITLRYSLPSGDVVSKQAVIYKHNVPQVVVTYAADNIVTGKTSGDIYGGGSSEWASKLQVDISFSNNDLEKVLEDVKIKGAEYYDEVSKKWIDTGCVVTDNTTCTWIVEENFNKNIKIRLINESDKKSDITDGFNLKVDNTSPVCESNNGNTTWAKSKTVSVSCSDNYGECSQNSFSLTYPKEGVKNKKTDNITIYDKAGNSNSCAVDIYVDSTPPSSCAITMKNSSGTTISNEATSTSDVTFSVSGLDNATDDSGIKTNTWIVTQGSNTYNNLANTNDKNNGTYSVVATCTDNAGNTTTSNASVVLDKSITITYYGNGNTGGSTSTTTCKFNQNCTIASNGFTKTGNSFAGWNTKTDGSGTSYSSGDVITSKTSINLYAKWNPVSYSISYVLNGGTNNSSNPSTYKYGTGVTSFANPTKTGATFGGWYSDSALTNKVTNISTTATGNKTLYAKWTVASYSITYVLNSGTNNSSNPSTYTYGTGVASFANPTRTGYTFGGWYKESSFTNKVTSISTTSTGAITLYAKWTANSYTLTYVDNEGSGCTSKTGTYGNTWSTLCTPTASNSSYDVFNGWYTGSNGSGTKVTTSTTVSGNLTVYAYWKHKPSISCSSSEYSWNKSSGSVKISATDEDNNFSYFNYQRYGLDTSYTRVTSNPYVYTGSHYRILAYAYDTDGYTNGSYCYTKFDNQKPYAPYITKIQGTENIASISENCTSLSTKSTSDVSCTVTLTKTEANAYASFNTSYNVADYSSSDVSGNSGRNESYLIRTYEDGTTCTEKTDGSWNLLSDECSKTNATKWVLYTVDTAGNVGAKLTYNIVWAN